MKRFLELGKRLPVNGKGQDILTVEVDEKFEQIYPDLLKSLLGQQKKELEPGNTPFQYMVQSCIPFKPDSTPNILKRIYLLAEQNPKKLAEKNLIGQNLYEMVYLKQTQDLYTSCLLLRLLLDKKMMNEADNKTKEGSLVGDAAKR